MPAPAQRREHGDEFTGYALPDLSDWGSVQGVAVAAQKERIVIMLAKVILTLEQDEQRGTNEAMEETIKLIAGLDVMPLMKIVFTLECEEVVAERYRATLRTALRERPIGIVAKFKTTTEEEVNRYVLPPVTPMDKIAGFAERHGASVELRAGGQVLATIRPGVSPATDDLFVNDDEELEDRDGNRRPMTATERQARESR